MKTKFRHLNLVFTFQFKAIIDDESKYLLYGNPDHPTVSPCKRINGSLEQNVLGLIFTIAEIAFINHYKRFPISGKELSHICGNNKCIVIEHIEEKTHKQNMKRISHHCVIKDYEEQIYRHLSFEVKTLTPGPIFVKNISKQDWKKLKPGPKTNKKYQKSEAQKKKEAVHRKRFLEIHGKGYIKPVPKRKPFKCYCRPPCFINFNKAIKQYDI